MRDVTLGSGVTKLRLKFHFLPELRFWILFYSLDLLAEASTTAVVEWRMPPTTVIRHILITPPWKKLCS